MIKTCVLLDSSISNGQEAGIVRGREVGGKRRLFYIPLFDAINRRNEQPTTVNIIFSPPLTVPTIKLKKINKK